MIVGVWPMAAQAATTITLGTAANFAVLGGSTVTNTGATTITGDVGVSPGTSITGFPPGILISGALQAGNPAAAKAQADLTTAYNNAAGQGCTNNLTGVDLGGKTLLPGVYCFNSSAQLTGILTLNFQGNPNAQFIFQIGSTITTASNSSVRLINTGQNSPQACSVFWQVGSSATLGTATAFAGTIMALTSITITTSVALTGRALAINGAVTLDTNIINNTCGINPVKVVCTQGAGNDADENADQSKNVAAGNESVKGDTDSASDRSENCDSGNSDKDKNNKDKNNKDKNNQDKNNQDKNNQDKKKS
jgi:type VI secretion system secreted protein VgrG